MNLNLNLPPKSAACFLLLGNFLQDIATLYAVEYDLEYIY